jgi:hypothetical protein
MGPFFNDCRVEISIFELDLYIDTIIIHVYYENAKIIYSDRDYGLHTPANMT